MQLLGQLPLPLLPVAGSKVEFVSRMKMKPNTVPRMLTGPSKTSTTGAVGVPTWTPEPISQSPAPCCWHQIIPELAEDDRRAVVPACPGLRRAGKPALMILSAFLYR